MSELHYIGLLLGLFVVPRALERFRIPAPVTSLAVGALFGIGFDLFRQDPTIRMLSTLGIASLFLFAGLELDSAALRKGLSVLSVHLLVRTALLGATAGALAVWLELGLRPAALFALALLTPSTGFIFQAISRFDLSEEERFWVKLKAIAAELLALGTMFVVIQTTTLARFAVSVVALTAMIVVLPMAFRFFAQKIAPFAPKSEFAFLLMLAVVCAFLTKKLGVYYLVGAFLVGVAAQRFRKQLPAMASEQMLNAVELFGSVFIPFYFFAAGLRLEKADFGLGALLLGGGFCLLFIPLRVFLVAVHRRTAMREPADKAVRVAVALLPTLVFGLVIAGILRDDFGASPTLTGAVIVYTVITTLVPGLLFRMPPPEYAPDPTTIEAPPTKNTYV
ncbi:MAG: cation:proton antiporter [Myxococcales bacterium]|nr:cation:proton antiporter [Myxococcales bacterium]